MLIVGVDPAARTIAIVAKHVETNTIYAQKYVLYKASAKQTNETLGCAVGEMRQFLQWVDIVAPSGERVAWVENPLVGRGGVKTTMKQAYVGGIIRGMLVEAGFTVHDVYSSSWKAFLGIKNMKTVDQRSNTSKAKLPVVIALKRRWPKVMSVIGDDGDLTDAAAVLLYGESKGTPDAPRPARRTVRGRRPGVVVRPARVQ